MSTILTRLQISEHSEISLSTFVFEGDDMLTIHIKTPDGRSLITATPNEIKGFLARSLEEAKLKAE